LDPVMNHFSPVRISTTATYYYYCYHY